MSTMNNTQQSTANQCAVCGCTLIEQPTTYTQTLNGAVVIVERVPTLVCSRCGQAYLTRNAAIGVERALATRNQERTATVAVYQFPA